MASTRKGTVRPAQGRNSTKPVSKIAAGGSNVRILAASNRNNKKRGGA